MEIQAAISLKKNRQLIGRSFKALVDDVYDDISIARIYSQTPDIDGVVLINDTSVKKGSFVNLKIEDVYDYDLRGSVAE
jgi:ribosomal protein S12 methylthiotransferase